MNHLLADVSHVMPSLIFSEKNNKKKTKKKNNPKHRMSSANILLSALRVALNFLEKKILKILKLNK